MAASYPSEKLRMEARWIKQQLADGKDVFAISTMRRETKLITQSSFNATVALMQEVDKVELASGE